MAVDNSIIPHMSYRRRTLPSDAVIFAEMRRLLEYDEENGGFKWIAARTPAARQYVGRRAGGPDGSGYVSVNVLTHKFKVHRLVWLWHHGETSRGMLDHINGDRTDNRIENLREATLAENVRNRARAGGLATGVSRDPSSGFKARIQLPDGGKVYLGTFATEAEASAAYVGAATILHGAFALHQREAA
jgi:hypothetical protein